MSSTKQFRPANPDRETVSMIYRTGRFRRSPFDKCLIIRLLRSNSPVGTQVVVHFRCAPDAETNQSKGEPLKPSFEL
jgi:hypothetical protein